MKNFTMFTFTAFHFLVQEIEKTVQAKEKLLCAFMDIECAFDSNSVAMVNSSCM